MFKNETSYLRIKLKNRFSSSRNSSSWTFPLRALIKFRSISYPVFCLFLLIYILNQFFHHYFFICSGTVFIPQYLKTTQAVLAVFVSIFHTSCTWVNNIWICFKLIRVFFYFCFVLFFVHYFTFFSRTKWVWNISYQYFFYSMAALLKVRSYLS